MAHNLARRVAHLETCLGTAKEPYRRLAEVVGVDLEQFLQAVKGHESELVPHLGREGEFTLQGLKLACKLMGIDIEPRGKDQPG